jgi:hypothetical protein
MGNLAIGVAAGAATTWLYYDFNSQEGKRLLAEVEGELQRDDLDPEVRKQLLKFRQTTLSRLRTLRYGAAAIGAATVICPVGGILFVIADRVFTNRRRTQYRKALSPS